MAEPTAAGTFAAAASTVTLAYLGLDYYALLYGFVGALLALSQAARMGRLRAVTYVGLSTLVGAAIGSSLVALADTTARSHLIVGCLVGGAGAHVLVSALISALAKRIERAGGQ